MGRSEICGNPRNLRIAIFLLVAPVAVYAQTFAPKSASSPPPSLSPTPTPPEETIIPTFETQKLARTYILDVPGRAARSRIATACPLPKIDSAITSRSIFQRPWIFPMRRR